MEIAIVKKWLELQYFTVFKTIKKAININTLLFRHKKVIKRLSRLNSLFKNVKIIQ